MKKSIKIISILLIAILMIAVASTTVMASSGDIDVGGTAAQITPKSTTNDEGIINAGGQILGIITTVGIVAAIIIIAVLGLKFMMGSAAEKAEYKKTMIPYLVGAVLLFGASAIGKAIITMASNVTG